MLRLSLAWFGSSSRRGALLDDADLVDRLLDLKRWRIIFRCFTR